MYRQILIHPDDRKYQCILWRCTLLALVCVYQLLTVTYGLACAPFLAIRTLRQLAHDEQSRYLQGAITLREDTYVDDVVSGANTLSHAIGKQTELRGLCTAGGFALRKWAANDEEVLSGIPPEHRLHHEPHSWENDSFSTLGLLWHPNEDTFAFAIHPRTVTEYTKRRVLSETARLFDPLGWLAPVVIRAKILIQSAWLQRLDWDDPLPAADAHCWRSFLEELPLLSRLRVIRWLGSEDEDAQAELHGFADASERGYAAAVYLRITRNGTVAIHLLAAKSKGGPGQRVAAHVATEKIEEEPEMLLQRPPRSTTSLLLWLRVVQALHFANEITALSANRTVSHRSSLASLSPFLDDHGVLRVGGRLKHAMLSTDERHPMIAPPSSWLTRCSLSRSTVELCTEECSSPSAYSASASGSLEAALLSNSGCIAALLAPAGEPRHCNRRWAVHLDVVSDYTTEAFLAAFRRFISRRGLCEELYSDCGTNFVGADRVLRKLFRASSADGRRLAHVAATESVKWHFNPPAAPHFGGLWEAAVKSTKFHLRRVIGETTLTFEEMSTFLAQVEACLNSRPLQVLSDDPDDMSALTPGHFLIGAPLLAVSEPSLIDAAESSLLSEVSIVVTTGTVFTMMV
ncbi:uncharacterized protein [Temnothorax longispinosus]|uniref:uncharacterized protein n=1 Tax=Temnothorax longispinosus TaxID=300112 RepID=UPI003A9A0322